MRQRWRGKHCLQAVNEDFESAVEHFFNFGRFCSTLAAAVGGFGVGGRQNSVEKSAFCLLWWLRGTGFDRRGRFSASNQRLQRERDCD